MSPWAERRVSAERVSNPFYRDSSLRWEGCWACRNNDISVSPASVPLPFLIHNPCDTLRLRSAELPDFIRLVQHSTVKRPGLKIDKPVLLPTRFISVLTWVGRSAHFSKCKTGFKPVLQQSKNFAPLIFALRMPMPNRNRANPDILIRIRVRTLSGFTQLNFFAAAETPPPTDPSPKGREETPPLLRRGGRGVRWGRGLNCVNHNLHQTSKFKKNAWHAGRIVLKNRFIYIISIFFEQAYDIITEETKKIENKVQR